jgi:hypothetical protein
MKEVFTRKKYSLDKLLYRGARVDNFAAGVRADPFGQNGFGVMFHVEH